MAGIDFEAFAKAAGLPVDLFKSGIGTILRFLREKLPGDLFGQVQQNVPEAQQMMDDSASKTPEQGGSILGTLTGALTGMLGASGGATELVSKLSAMGLTVEQIRVFLPKVLDFFRALLPTDLLTRVMEALQKGEQKG